MARLFVNNLEMLLTVDVSPADTSIVVDDASRMPPLVGGDYILLTIEAPSGDEPREIVRATAVGGNTIFVTRAQEGTIAQDHFAGASVENRNTAETLESLPQRDMPEAISGKWDYDPAPSVAGQDVWNSGNVLTSDAEMISVDGTDPASPLLDIHSNVANGVVKLGPDGKVPIDLVPISGLQPLGPYRGDNDCPKEGDDPPSVCVVPDYRNPSERFPACLLYTSPSPRDRS